jgi:hypothetical protein
MNNYIINNCCEKEILDKLNDPLLPNCLLKIDNLSDNNIKSTIYIDKNKINYLKSNKCVGFKDHISYDIVKDKDIQKTMTDLSNCLKISNNFDIKYL